MATFGLWPICSILGVERLKSSPVQPDRLITPINPAAPRTVIYRPDSAERRSASICAVRHPRWRRRPRKNVHLARQLAAWTSNPARSWTSGLPDTDLQRQRHTGFVSWSQVRRQFDCNSTTLRSFDDLRYDRGWAYLLRAAPMGHK